MDGSFSSSSRCRPGALPRGFADFAENPAAAGARSAVHHSVNGLPWSGNNYLLDGVANNEPLNAFINITPPLEAIQEFKVQTNNPTAEFGVFGGAVVNLSIRSGTESIQWVGLRVLPRRCALRPEFLRGDQSAVQLASVRDHVRRTRSCATAPFSSAITRVCVRTRVAQSSPRFPRLTCGAVT